jgi:hypothetical protein
LEKKYFKKVKKNNFEKDFWTFREKPTLDHILEVNILADANFQATYLKIGVDYEFNIKNNI